MSSSCAFYHSCGVLMHVDVFIPNANLESLIIARMIQLKSNNELFITTEKAEFGFPNEACGLIHSPTVLNELKIEPLPSSISLSLEKPFALRSEWLEKHLAIVLAKNGAKLQTRSRIEIESKTQGYLRGATIYQGPITWNKIVNIDYDTNLIQWYGTISASDELSAEHKGVRNDGTIESWKKEQIESPSILERRISFGSETSPFYIDDIVLRAKERFQITINSPSLP